MLCILNPSFNLSLALSSYLCGFVSAWKYYLLTNPTLWSTPVILVNTPYLGYYISSPCDVFDETILAILEGLYKCIRAQISHYVIVNIPR